MKTNSMATITLKYDAKNVQVQKTLEYILAMGFFCVENKREKTGIEKSFEDIEKGRVYRVNDLDKLYEECLK